MIIALRMIITLVLLFFAAGAVFAIIGKFSAESYIIVTGIVGSIASVIGLIALGSARLTAADMRNVEAELLKSVADQVRAAKEVEDKLATNREEINRLEKERAEIELIVRQASLKLFMEERLHYIAAEVDKRISADRSLIDLLDEYKNALARVQDLNGQIDRSEKADVVQQILRDARDASRSKREFIVTVMGERIDIHPIVDLLQKVASSYAALLRSVIR